MAARAGFTFTFRKHWKKSIFVTGLLFYGVDYATKRYREHLVRREYFSEATKFGDGTCSPLEKPRRLYIVLNSTAGNSNCKQLFQKNAAPIFYLAGIDITYLQTSYEGHAKTLVNYFDPTIDGVVVAGGDGTLQEVVTGMLRLENDENITKLPVGFIPLGYRSNYIYKKLFHTDVVNVRAMCKAAMAVVKEYTKHVSVMEIKTDEKSVFALSSIHVGINGEVKEKIDAGKYWLLGPLKKYFAYILRTVKNWPPSCVFEVSSITSPIEKLNLQMASNKTDIETKNLQSQTKDFILQDCSLRENVSHTTGASLYLQERDDGQEPYIILQNTISGLSREDFIKFGWQWIKNNFTFTPSPATSKSMACSQVVVNPPVDENLTYGIDGETFDARPIQVSVCPKKILMFCDPPEC